MTQQVILSIQSAVMHGAVGNEAAMPVYQHLKQPAERLDTVRLAAHPGFGTSAISITPPQELQNLLNDYCHLANFQNLGAVQTGYFGLPSQIDPVARFISSSRAIQRNLIYLLDPVLGDGGRLYVDQAISDRMRDHLLPLADILTPNQFELGLLADTPITNEIDAISAARSLIKGRLQTVFATGIATAAGQIVDILVCADTQTLIPAEKQSSGVSGSGDVLSAFFLSAVMNGKTTQKAAEIASYSTAQILRRAETRLTMPVLRTVWEGLV